MMKSLVLSLICLCTFTQESLFAATPALSKKARVAIIGAGGAGINLARLLDEDAQVTLFEQDDRLGGHADTRTLLVHGKKVPMDIAFEYFTHQGSPLLSELLKSLDVAADTLPVSYTYYQADGSDTFLVTPFQDGKTDWGFLKMRHLLSLIELKYLVTAGQAFLNRNLPEVTLEEFVEEFFLTRPFKEDFFYLFAGAAWGVSANEIKKFSAHHIFATLTQNMSFFSIHPPDWNQIAGGTSVYIAAVAKQLNRTEVKLNSRISKILYEDSLYRIFEEDGTVSVFDELVLATHADQARELLKDVPEVEEVREILGQFDYYLSALALHGDRSLMPEDESKWSVVNIRYDGSSTSMTNYYAGRSAEPVFKTWLTHPDMDLPEPLYDLEYHTHPKLNRNYILGQKALVPLQGKNHLWLAGVYTHGVNGHESALISAIKIAKKLTPQSARLQEWLHPADGRDLAALIPE